MSRRRNLGIRLTTAGFVLAASLVIPPTFPALAHEPLFMMSHEAPGKGAFDLHLSFGQDDSGDEVEREVEAEFTLGITRDLAVKLTLPYAWVSESGPRRMALADPSVGIKWRLFDKNLLGRKYAIAVKLASTIPTDSRTGRDRPVLRAGLSHGREGLHWYYFVDTRYQYAVALRDQRKPGDLLWFDAAYGIRPRLRKMDETDVVFFCELNYLRREGTVLPGGARDPNSGGDFLFVSPEVLVAPTNRIMFKAGARLPVARSPNGRGEDPGISIVASMEFRFGF